MLRAVADMNKLELTFLKSPYPLTFTNLTELKRKVSKGINYLVRTTKFPKN